MYFEIDIHDNLESGRGLPLYISGNKVDSLNLIGSFVAKRGDRVSFFVAKEDWVGLLTDGSHKFYFRPMRDEQRVIIGGLLEEAKTSDESVEIKLSGGQDGTFQQE